MVGQRWDSYFLLPWVDLFCLYFHIGGYLKSKSILERFDLVFKKLTQNRTNNPSFEDEESSKPDLTLDNPTSRKAKIQVSAF